MKKTVAILGVSGSVGRQALEVAKNKGCHVDFMSGCSNISALENMARAYKPRAVAMADESSASELRVRLADTDIKVYSGEEGILEGISESEADTVINAILGKAGLAPTLRTISEGKTLALANKESLVVAGDIVMAQARRASCSIIPVDSEHSAIFQSMASGKRDEIRRLILTASGGPFFGKSREELKSVTLGDALNHPTWKMGKKISTDSATLMNKGFEIIEASHLFGVDESQIEVVVHRESILHSAVEYIDNIMIGQFSLPDMRSCIQYAIEYPNRSESLVSQLDLTRVGSLTFYKPDTDAFPLLSLARQSIRDGGAYPAVLNALDEVAVEAFLEGKITFFDISELIAGVYGSLHGLNLVDSLDGILECDREARAKMKEKITR
ncbi:MAG: 1-deoxy-D-xylulose-5-phosphate reductoisomerase [Clostridia bacterium]|nr:1-deoxy-D-xylulose-5-phosphate reductoisomerase [Clostridia bacterium]